MGADVVQCPPMGGLCVKEKQETAAFWKTFGLAALLWAALAAGSELLFPSSAAAPAGAAGLLRSCLVLPVAEELVFRGAALRLLRPLGRNAAILGQAVLFALLPLLLGNRWAGLAGVFAMGLLMYLLNTPAQMHALSLAEQDYPFASSLCASVQPVSYNFGIAIGSFIGSAVQEGWGFRPLGLPAAMFALAALGLNLLLLRANGRRTAAAAS